MSKLKLRFLDPKFWCMLALGGKLDTLRQQHFKEDQICATCGNDCLQCASVVVMLSCGEWEGNLVQKRLARSWPQLRLRCRWVLPTQWGRYDSGWEVGWWWWGWVGGSPTTSLYNKTRRHYGVIGRLKVPSAWTLIYFASAIVLVSSWTRPLAHITYAPATCLSGSGPVRSPSDKLCGTLYPTRPPLNRSTSCLGRKGQVAILENSAI